MRFEVRQKNLAHLLSMNFSRPRVFYLSLNDFDLDLLLYLRNVLEEDCLKNIRGFLRIKHAHFLLTYLPTDLIFLDQLFLQTVNLRLFSRSLIHSEVIINLTSDNFVTQPKTAHLLKEVLDFDVRKAFKRQCRPIDLSVFAWFFVGRGENFRVSILNFLPMLLV